MNVRLPLVCLFVCLLAAPALAGGKIAKEDVLAAQQEWGAAIVAIGKAHNEGGDYQALAGQVVDELYAFDLGPVLFKPTKAAEDQFRTTKEEALSYFVGGIRPEDKGFALHPWSQVRFEEQYMVLHDCDAVTQGNYFFTDPATGAETKVEFTFGYIRDPQGRLRIFLHHSSLPFDD